MDWQCQCSMIFTGQESMAFLPIASVSRFLSNVKKHIYRDEQRCKQSDYENSCFISSNGKGRIYKCHAGLWEFGIPIIFRHKTVAAICGGQFRPPNFKKNSLKELASNLTLDEAKLTNAFNDLRRLTKKDLQKITLSLDYFAKKIIRSVERQRVIEEAVQFKWLLESRDWAPNKILKQINDRCRELVGGINHGCIIQSNSASGTKKNIAPCPKGNVNCLGEKAGCQGIKWVIEHKEAILVRDVQNDTRYNKELGTEETRAKIVAPIMHGEDVIGVINLNSKEPNSLDESDKEIIQLLAPLASMAIKASEQFDTLKTLYSVGLSLTSSLDLPDVLQNIVGQLRKIIHADVVILFPYDKERENFAYRPFKDGVIRNEKQMVLAGKCERIVKSISQKREPYFADNVEGDKELDNKFARAEGIKSSAGVPLIFKRDIMGALFVNFKKPHHFTEEDQRLIEMFGSLSAVVINRAQLQEKMTFDSGLVAMGKTIAEIAHRISNPLGVIYSTIENLQRNNGNISNEKLGIKLVKIIENVDRIKVIKDRILNPSRLTKKLERINVNKVISGVMQSLKDEDKLTSNIKDFFYPDDLPELILDFDDIREVFLSLMYNAINAMPNEGLLKIETHCSEKKQEIEIVIEDSGCGISSDRRKKIFEPFETTTAYGTGLGLTISKDIIESYGGCINVESEEGKGTSFIVKLPLNEKTRGREALGFSVGFFNELLETPPEVEKIKEMGRRFDNVLSEANKSISLATSDFEVKLIDNFKIAKTIFYNRGEGVSIVGGRMEIGRDYIVNDNYEIVDEIRDAIPGSNATVFQIIGEQAVRISTNVKNEDGKRAINTVVSPPVYQEVVKEKKVFTGLAWVLKERCVARYEPIFDVNRNVVGILYIGMPEMHPQIIEKLAGEVSSLKFNDGGYVFIINEEGNTIYHPYLSSGFDFSKEVFYQNEMQSKKGWMDATYRSEKGLMQEIIHYHHFPEWNWIICATCPKEEILTFFKRRIM